METARACLEGRPQFLVLFVSDGKCGGQTATCPDCKAYVQTTFEAMAQAMKCSHKERFYICDENSSQ